LQKKDGARQTSRDKERQKKKLKKDAKREKEREQNQQNINKIQKAARPSNIPSPSYCKYSIENNGRCSKRAFLDITAKLEHEQKCKYKDLKPLESVHERFREFAIESCGHLIGGSYSSAGDSMQKFSANWCISFILAGFQLASLNDESLGVVLSNPIEQTEFREITEIKADSLAQRMQIFQVGFILIKAEDTSQGLKILLCRREPQSPMRGFGRPGFFSAPHSVFTPPQLIKLFDLFAYKPVLSPYDAYRKQFMLAPKFEESDLSFENPAQEFEESQIQSKFSALAAERKTLGEVAFYSKWEAYKLAHAEPPELEEMDI